MSVFSQPWEEIAREKLLQYSREGRRYIRIPPPPRTKKSEKKRRLKIKIPEFTLG